MYRNASRGASMSGQSGEVAGVNLETIEGLQDAWCRQFETLRDPPPPPLLDSPRSLRACALRGVNPKVTLQKFSLKQHLFCVLGKPHMLRSLPHSTTKGYEALMQSALRSFSEMAVGLGTSQEKLAAFVAFQNQERLRAPQLAALQELRRQLIAEDVLDGMRPQHRPGDDLSTVTSDTVSGVHRDAAGHRGEAHRTAAAELLSTSRVREDLLRDRRHFANHHHEGSAMGAPKASCTSPSHGPLASTSSARATPASKETFDDVCDRGLADFEATPSPSRNLPYTPRDVSLLNSSYFSNRSIQGRISNPSGAPLPTSCPGTPASSWRGVTSTARPANLSANKQHLSLPVVTSLVNTTTDDVPEALDRKANGKVELCSLSKQELSIVSINSSHLELLLGMGESAPTSRPADVLQRSPTAVLVAGREKAHQGSRSNYTLPLFPDFGEGGVSGSAAAAALEGGVNATSPRSTPALTSATSNQSLTPLARRTYTNHATRSSQLVPNMLARSVQLSAEMKVPLSCAGTPVAAASRTEEGCAAEEQQQRAAASSSPPPPKAIPTELTALGASEKTAALSRLPSPPVITQAEQHEGFLYYCANPSHHVNTFYQGVHETPMVTVQL
ncbi:hypothetical protein JKF63_01864 [Porcisia hertigi]|uniref:Uncharacterized protein n=1 Tax=Porcisia hertigi TaxID=2761500 RepID=A0A836L0H1_9TRYP|nr:hypothetical protein JKF63_01864 [Porcisia hertigi]